MKVISKAFVMCAALAFAACGDAEVPGTFGADATTPDVSPPLDAFVEGSDAATRTMRRSMRTLGESGVRLAARSWDESVDAASRLIDRATCDRWDTSACGTAVACPYPTAQRVLIR